MKYCLLILLITTLPYLAQAQKQGTITGKVLNKYTQLAIPNATVSTGSSSTTTDSVGAFVLNDIPVSTLNLTISSVGYKPYTVYNIVLNSGNISTYTIELEPQVSTGTTVVVRANKRSVRAASIETPLSVQRLTYEEIKASPGGNFDISKAIQTLPGVGGGAQGGSFRNDIIIRGGAPNENVFYLDGIEVPVINHFQTQGSSGGPQGILNVSFIEDVKLSTSAFGAQYDNAISSVFQFKQKNGNKNKLQGNFRLSATEAALTLDGPLSSSKKTTFLASIRRSYLQLLFQALDLPIRPNYWDAQFKVTHTINPKTTLTILGVGAVDEFRFEAPKTATPEKLYLINSNVLVNQWNYTLGATLKRTIPNGYYNVSLSNTNFNNSINRYEDNQNPTAANQLLNIGSTENETKLRLEVNTNRNGYKWTSGASIQLAQYTNNTRNTLRKQLTDGSGNIIQPAVIINFNSPLPSLAKLGAFTQVSKRYAGNRLGVSAGIRSDMNTFTTNGLNPLAALSPRISASYTVTDEVTLNASIGTYYKLAPYTILGFADSANNLLNKAAKYLRSNHYTTGVEYVPNDGLRFTLEGFYKQYSNVPVSVRNGIALSNLGADFNLLGNEAITTTGRGRAYGMELFAQKKLTNKFFGILSYTLYKSQYSGSNGVLVPSSWDNGQLLSITWGYKLKRNWELGLKFRYQGGAPYTPFDEVASRLNFLSQGVGIPDFARLNTLRLQGFNSSDVRIDKKWNLKKTTLNLFLDVSNWYVARNPAVPEYTFTRNATNTAFATTDGNPIQPNGSNAIPTRVRNDDPQVTPTIGFIIEF